MLINQSVELTFRHHRVGKVQTVELNLPWTVVIQGFLGRAVIFLKIVDELIVQRTVRHKLQRANRVGHALEVVALTMREVIHWVAMPLCASAVMWSLDNAIHHGVTEMHVWICHVHLCTEHHGTFNGLSGIHVIEEPKILLNGAVAIRTERARHRRSAFLLCNLLRCLLIHVCVAILYHPDGEIPQLLEIV